MQTVEATVSASTPGTFSCCLSGLLTNVDPFPSQIYGSILSPTFSPTLPNRQLLIEIELKGHGIDFSALISHHKTAKGRWYRLSVSKIPPKQADDTSSDHWMCGRKGGGLQGLAPLLSSDGEAARGEPKTGREERQRGRVVVIRTSVMQPYAPARLVVDFGQLSSDDSLLGLVETKAKCTFGLRRLCFLHGFTQNWLL